MGMGLLLKVFPLLGLKQWKKSRLVTAVFAEGESMERVCHFKSARRGTQ